MKLKLKLIALAIIGSMSLYAAETAAPAAQPAAAQPAAVAAQPAAVQPAAAQPAVAQPEKHEAPGIGICIARGFCNVLTGWLEIPRCMIYDNSAIPVFGLIVGIPEGALFTVVRELSGVFDIVSFGCTGHGIYGEVFCDTVFQSRWTPSSK